MKYNAFIKNAGIYADIAKGVPGYIATAPVGSFAPSVFKLGGTIAGYAVDNPEDTYDKEWKKWVPGVSTAGILGQRRSLSERYGNDDGRMTMASEQCGSITAGLGAMLLGSAIGATVGGISGGGAGAVSGAGLGLAAGGAYVGASEAVSALAALLKRTRTKDEQRAYEQGSHASNWLIPGMGSYNALKSYGRLHADQNEEEQAAKNKKKSNG